MKRILFLFVALLSFASLSAKDIKTVIFTTEPQMHCENCEQKIKKNIRFAKGVKQIETSVADQTVTISYDADKTSPALLTEAFKKIGYTVRQLKKGEKVARNADEACPNM